MIWDIVGIVVLTLLKILGIFLLILLALFLLVLLVPIRYRVRAAFYEDYEVRGSISWLCFLFRFPFCWRDGQLQWKLQILGIPFLKSTKSASHNRNRSSGKKSRKGRKPGKTEKQAVLSEETYLSKDEIGKQGDGLALDSGDAAADQREKTEDSIPARYKQPEDAQNKKKHKKQSLPQRLWQKIKELYRAVCDMIQNIREKVHSVQDLIQLLQKDSSRRFICITKENMLQLWRHLKPQKIWGDIRFGTGDPCSTGQILGGIAVFYSWLGTGVHITPDFEEACFEGRIAGKGRIRIITMMVILIRMIMNKDFRTLRRELGQWKEDL